MSFIIGRCPNCLGYCYSDIDFLVEIEPQRTLLDQIALMQSLEELLGRKVDVAEPETLHELIRDKVLWEAVVL
ncbi:nucleotidyltransferase family protein [Fortiea sp. LEGE XX443]|uniref:nucleotidyltransferase family protein n=1 Tax=Fortiea sp. LEGE XX443 TaxID=1828611 RepID=UPI001D14C5D4|nr:nucleotidyltransferase domain-containing protein [Fortiea sp. LEGE XX443]